MKQVISLLSLLLLVSACSNRTNGQYSAESKSVEVYEYYPNGGIKSIGNYIDGKSGIHDDGFQIRETLSYEEVIPLLDTLGIRLTLMRAPYTAIGMCDDAMRMQIDKNLESINTEGIIPNMQLLWSDKKEAYEGKPLHYLYAVKTPGKRDTYITSRDMVSAQKSYDQRSQQTTVDVTFTGEGITTLGKLTGDNVGNPLAMVVNGRVISAPTVNEAIWGGKLQISGNFTDKEAEDLVALINMRVLNGECREYHENGNLKSIRNYTKGEQTGSWKAFDENGKLIREYKR